MKIFEIFKDDPIASSEDRYKMYIDKMEALRQQWMKFESIVEKIIKDNPNVFTNNPKEPYRHVSFFTMLSAIGCTSFIEIKPENNLIISKLEAIGNKVCNIRLKYDRAGIGALAAYRKMGKRGLRTAIWGDQPHIRERI
jgi:hypothetical protein